LVSLTAHIVERVLVSDEIQSWSLDSLSSIVT